RFDRREITNAAAKLRRNFDRLQNGLDRCSVNGLAGKSPVEIDDVQVLEALPLEGERLRRRIVVEHGRRVHFAELEAHALAVFKVDGWKKDQLCLWSFCEGS